MAASQKYICFLMSSKCESWNMAVPLPHGNMRRLKPDGTCAEGNGTLRRDREISVVRLARSEAKRRGVSRARQ